MRPRDLAEVRELLAYARRHRRHLTFRAAGTSLSGQAVTDDLLVEVAPFWRGVRVLDGGRRVWVQPGVVGAPREPPARSPRHAPRPRSRLDRRGHGRRHRQQQLLGDVLRGRPEQLPHPRFAGRAAGRRHARRHRRGRTRTSGSATTAPTSGRASSPCATRSGPTLPLAERIRRKFSRKNTTGYSLNAFVDYDRPADILAHLDGGLGGDARLPRRGHATERCPTRPRAPPRSSPSPSWRRRGPPSSRWRRRERPRSRSSTRRRSGPSPPSTRMPSRVDPAHRRAPRGVPHGRRGGARRRRWGRRGTCWPATACSRPPASRATPQARAQLWKLRKGLFASTGRPAPARAPSVLTEDVAVPVERLAEAIADFQDLFAREGVPDTVLFGHAKDGNLHFVLAEDLRSPEAVERFGTLHAGRSWTSWRGSTTARSRPSTAPGATWPPS